MRDYERDLQRNFDLCIPSKGTARPLSQFLHSCVCERFKYSHHRSINFPAAEYADQSWEYINRKQKHECRNLDCGRAVLSLGIYVSNFRYSIFAVCFVRYILIVYGSDVQLARRGRTS
jgi:hypothetical protein